MRCLRSSSASFFFLRLLLLLLLFFTLFCPFFLLFLTRRVTAQNATVVIECIYVCFKSVNVFFFFDLRFFFSDARAFKPKRHLLL